VEFTYEDNGLSDRDVDVGIYLSDEGLISTFDDPLGGFGTSSLAAMCVHRQDSRHHPRHQAPGDYWIGAVIDEDATVNNEVTESDNATWIRMTIE
jgi:hypothetical protein